MTTKILAAQRASRAGTDTIIANGRETDVLLRLRRGESIGTHLQAQPRTLDARKRWLANQLKVRGKVILDAGAHTKLAAGAASLLAIGITAVDGEFYRGQLVSCINSDGQEVARGLVNYSSTEIQQILGQHSSDIEQILGFIHEPEVINRDVMVLM